MNPKVNGGWTMDRERFSDGAQKIFAVAIDHRRRCFTLGQDELKGARFNDDMAVWARIESMFPEVEFMACPGPCIDKALHDASCSDWWYTFEKRYDDEPMSEDCQVDEDE